jgi:polysaccharide export outer membrane protein
MKISSAAAAVQVLFVSVACLLGGCTKERHSTPNALGPNGVFKQASGHDVSSSVYIIDPPDQIHLIAPDIKELDGLTQPVRADGKITMNLLGEVKVAGLTPDAAAERIKELVSKYYLEPRLQVEVIANSKYYSVFGFGAGGPGRKAYTGNNSILSAMTEIQFADGGWPQQVIISRPGRGEYQTASVVVDFTKIMEYGDLTQNYALEEGDIIYIPLSPISSFTRNLGRFTAPILGTNSVIAGAANLGNAYHH